MRKLSSFFMGHKILIVDDSFPIIELLKFVLSSYQPTIVSCGNGEEALSLARDERFDLIISDVEMPLMDGISFGIELRKFNSETPIIFFSAYNKFWPEFPAELAGIGKAALVTDKSIEELLNAISGFLKVDLKPFKK